MNDISVLLDSGESLRPLWSPPCEVQREVSGLQPRGRFSPDLLTLVPWFWTLSLQRREKFPLFISHLASGISARVAQTY